MRKVYVIFRFAVRVIMVLVFCRLGISKAIAQDGT